MNTVVFRNTLVAIVLFFVASTGIAAHYSNILPKLRDKPLSEKRTESDSQVLGAQSQSSTSVTENEVVETESLAFDTQFIDDANLNFGIEVTRQDGVTGIEHITYLITYNDGIVTHKKVLHKAITQQPVAKVVAKGIRVARNASTVATATPPPATTVNPAPTSDVSPPVIREPDSLACTEREGRCTSHSTNPKCANGTNSSEKPTVIVPPNGTPGSVYALNAQQAGDYNCTS